MVPAADLAELYRDMYLERDRLEEVVAPGVAVAVRGGDVSTACSAMLPGSTHRTRLRQCR